MPVSNSPKAAWQPAAAIVAWIIPGAGHWMLGQRARGLILLLTVGSLYLSGLLIGGISCVDRRESTLWFAAQLFTGPVTIGVDQWHQALKPQAKLGVTFPGANQPDYSKLPYVQSIGRVNELGTLFCAVAGLLNLLLIVDVLYYRPPTADAEPADDAPSPGRLVTRENMP